MTTTRHRVVVNEVRRRVSRNDHFLGVANNRVVPLSRKMVVLRFLAARAAGVEHMTAHSGRVGLASELTSRGASTTGTGGRGGWWRTYSAGATAERGAVARYL